ncbi:MAG: stage 0 sporulation protein [bacterium (Candidatus Stahlbacteria) CG23_combo_of_CG06-09_8_20_14_all_34_7]|nr:MAG: stage 0 sporulation protein [bacterium (Candidatus Stahlbacteria) CG23_combo_of_CG06-09_8_20_14_all_34_7]
MFGRVEFGGYERALFEIPSNVDIEEGKSVICQHEQGLDIGFLLKIYPYNYENPIGKILRKATDDDMRLNRSNQLKEKDSYPLALKRIEEANLSIKLIDIKIHFDGQHMTFYFISEKRVDFRQLVKSLASLFHMRIRMKQIGIRDSAKRIGGYGPCGQEMCCKRFLSNFEAITLQTLKDQNLSMTPQKVSGMCGRLMCCLMYEMDFYDEVSKKFPPLNTNISTEKYGDGKIVKIDIYNDSVTVKYEKVEENGGLLVHTLDEFNRIKKKKWSFFPKINENSKEE